MSAHFFLFFWDFIKLPVRWSFFNEAKIPTISGTSLNLRNRLNFNLIDKSKKKKKRKKKFSEKMI